MELSRHFPNLQSESLKFPTSKVKVFAYGTAGFRDKGYLLDTIVFRTGLLAAIRAYQKKQV